MNFLRRQFDLIVALSTGLLVAWLLLYFDYLEWWYETTRKYESWELDEILSALLAMLVASLWLSVRRSHQLRRAIAAKHEVSLRLQYAVEATQDGIWDWYIDPGVSRDDRVTRFPAADMALVAPSAVAFLALVHVGDRPGLEEVVGKCVRGEVGGFSAEARVRMDTGYFRWMLIRGKVVERHADGSPRRVVGTRTDLSELKQLKKAWADAQAASRAKSEFLALMSHELRTPLNAVIGFSTVIADEALGPSGGKYREYGADIRAAGLHLLTVVDDILALAMVQSGQVHLDEEEFQLDELVENVRRMVQGLADERSLELSIDANTGITMLGDITKIKRALINLLFNAIKFTEAGGRVSVNVCRDEENRVVVAISDTGIGIPEDDIELVFSSFHQVESHRQRRHEGSGLGLPITKAIVEQHGGAIAMRSVVGEGTTVTLTLPAERVIEPSIGAVGGEGAA